MHELQGKKYVVFRFCDLFQLNKEHFSSLNFLSGRITAVHNDSGLKGTWSWNSSNFHSDDVMDLPYTDPNHIPMYSLDGISDAILEVLRIVVLITLQPNVGSGYPFAGTCKRPC